ncbi:thioredoxin family protein [Halopenitus persicus]|uniref:Thioredoxin n=1 Tax=Halopenitus persicus TaxID=1048396 RepID=A0A1H3KSU4_9EURY|nr:thioredoxin family protein [Halopenitus persicus]SDY55257.1 Thioredoxin [Halopenitus persicus]
MTADPSTATGDAAAGDAVAAGDRPIDLDTGDELDAFLAEHDVALVEFYTKGCTLCQSVEPVLGTVARAADVAVATVNPRTDLSLVEAYDVRSVPTLVLFVDGSPVDRLAEGFVGVERVLDLIREHAPERVPEAA